MYYIENNLKLNNKITLNLEIWELLKYIKNANKIFVKYFEKIAKKC